MGDHPFGAGKHSLPRLSPDLPIPSPPGADGPLPFPGERSSPMLIALASSASDPSSPETLGIPPGRSGTARACEMFAEERGLCVISSDFSGNESNRGRYVAGLHCTFDA